MYLIKITPNNKSKSKLIRRSLREMATKFDEHETLDMGLRQRAKNPKLKNSFMSFTDSPQIPKKKKEKRRPFRLSEMGPL